MNLKQLQRERASLETRRAELQREATILDLQLRDVDAKLARATPSLRVSEHALLRYLERRFDLALDALRDGILSKVIDLDGKYPLGDGLRAVVRNKTVVTVELGK